MDEIQNAAGRDTCKTSVLGARTRIFYPDASSRFMISGIAPSDAFMGLPKRAPIEAPVIPVGAGRAQDHDRIYVQLLPQEATVRFVRSA